MNWKLISWNVNGIRAAEKKGFLEWLALSGADLVAVQETKAHPDQLSPALMNPPGYQSAWNSAEKKGYSGTVTYSKTHTAPGHCRFGCPPLRHRWPGAHP
jgi:exodeoxyribonuclease-3